ncbi:ABC transporter permease [Clostridium cellulovorans]|uniref:ABC transporter permease n=1 Tax=Clostridium cellulovorans (strain ATCC 35296 / DSM 3052 / OCM 3 / 743B) TaxID=573061 RepID=D9SQG6_CLOC7|nr:ABC-2 family transporter protein [Clostridium cellulovorans]ADL50233.1 protein of unknown function DUF990 [Clostridium cellulovorans 743B]
MLRRYSRLYIKFVSQYFKSLMEYKIDFLVGCLGFFVAQASGIVFIYLVFQNIPDLNGWDFYQIVFIYAFAQLPRGIDHLFTDNLWILGGWVILRGELDKYLLRPINPLFHFLAEKFQLEALGELVIGIILMVIAGNKLNLHLNALDIILFIILVFAGALIYTAIKLFAASLSFWIKNSQSLLNFIYNVSDFAKYPLSIYSLSIKIILILIVSFAFTAYFPAAYFVNKESFVTGVLGTVAASIISFTIAYFTWIKGMKNYEGAGN